MSLRRSSTLSSSKLNLITYWVHGHEALTDFLYQFYLVQYPHYTLGVAVISHFFLWYVVGPSTPVTLAALLLAIYVVLLWLYEALGLQAQWETVKTLLLKAKVSPTAALDHILGNSPLTKREVIVDVTFFYFKFLTWSDALRQLRAQNAPKFTVRVAVLLLIVAYLGSIIPGFWMLYALFTFAIFGPTIYIYRIPVRLVYFFRPYMDEAYEAVGGNEETLEALLKDAVSEEEGESSFSDYEIESLVDEVGVEEDEAEEEYEDDEGHTSGYSEDVTESDDEDDDDDDSGFVTSRVGSLPLLPSISSEAPRADEETLRKRTPTND